MNTTAAPASVPTAAAPRAAAPRLDLYAPIHKALRALMSDTLCRVGRVDIDDADELADTMVQVHGLLDLCRNHLDHENRYLHTAIESRRPGVSLRVAGEHLEHLDAIAALEADAAALRALPGAAAAHRFYRHLALFVAENFEHMNGEETVHNAALWATHSDAELADVHQRLVGSVPPAELALVLRWMVPALSPAERAAMLGAMQRELPPEAMRGVLDTVRPHLDDRAWAKLARALGIPPVPGLVGV